MDRLASFRVWKRLHAPEHIIQDPYDPYHLIYNHVDPNYPKSVITKIICMEKVVFFKRVRTFLQDKK